MQFMGCGYAAPLSGDRWLEHQKADISSHATPEYDLIIHLETEIKA